MRSSLRSETLQEMKFPSVARLCGCVGRRRPGEAPRPKATPLPLLKVITVGSVIFINQFGSLMIFPFLPFMVHDFFPELSREELGKKAGYLGSAFFLGNFIGSFAWGWASDIFGRKRVMLIGLWGTILSDLLFGFSQNFGWAVAARFLSGSLNGNLGVGKTYISEICDDTNQARGFSVIGTGSGLGRIVGSVVGGFLAQPAAKYTVLQIPFFCQFPYVLPCLVGTVIGLFSFIAAFIFLDETLHKSSRGRDGEDGSDSERKDSTDSGIELSRQLQEEDEERNEEEDRMMTGTMGSPVMMESDIDSESDGGVLSFDESAAASDTELLINEERSTERNRRRGRGKGRVRRLRQWTASWSPHVVVGQTRSRGSVCWTRCGARATACLDCTPRKFGMFIVTQLKVLLHKLLEVARLMKDRKVVLSTSLYGMYGGIAVMLNEAFPLLMVTDHHKGGYHLDDNEIGMVIMCSGVVQLLWQLLVYPYVVKWLGYRKTLQFGVIIFIFCCIVLPFSNRITGPITSAEAANDTSNLSGSGSGNIILDMSTTDLNSTLYCGDDQEDLIGVNPDSIKRVPIQVWAVLIAVMLLLVVARVSGFVSLFVLIGNSTLPSTRGSVNGISQSMVAVGRSVGPVLGSTLLSWSESNGLGWPLNYHFVFDLCAVLGVVLIIISLFLPKSSETKRETLEGSSGVSTSTT